MSNVVVITGSSRGLGLGLALRFLEAGCMVMVNGSSEASTGQAMQELKSFGDKVAGYAADVSRPEGLEQLFDAAERAFGRVDIWINNAGIVQRQVPVWELGADEIDRMFAVDVGGVVHGTTIPFRKMRKAGGGLILNMEGFGSDGFMMPGMTIYGTTKSAVTYFTHSFAKEAEGFGVRVGTMSPGMVVTDMLKSTVASEGDKGAKRRSFFNVMADDVQTVSSFLCREVLASTAASPRIVWLSKPRFLLRMVLAPFRRRRDLFG